MHGQPLTVPTIINLGNLPIGANSSYAQYSTYFSITNNTNYVINIINISAWADSTNNYINILNGVNNPYVAQLSSQQSYYPTLNLSIVRYGQYNLKDTNII